MSAKFPRGGGSRTFFSSKSNGVCRPLEEESSFCLGLSTRPVSEVVPKGLIPRFLDLMSLL